MQTDLETLLALQADDVVIHALEVRLAALEPRIRDLDQRRQRVADAIERSAAATAAEEKKQAFLREKIAEHKLLIERNQAQMDAVKGADVVVTNPTHVAVALRYERGRDRAPRVVCKGEGQRAAAIRAVAQDGGVALMRNVPLAHALLRLDIGEAVPEELFDAVAEILNFVWGLERGRRAS